MGDLFSPRFAPVAVIAETARLTLREFSGDDAGALEHVFGDPEVMQYSVAAKMLTTEVWLAHCRESYARRGFGRWAVVEKASGDVVGYCGLMHLSEVAGQPETELGYRLARPYWGMGLATEAAAAVRDCAFGTLGLLRLVALVDPSNCRSIRVAEKIGMRYEKEVLLEGYTYADRMYVITRDERDGSSC
jgi:RimJ/RimL family protein N-acetyltransferase